MKLLSYPAGLLMLLCVLIGLAGEASDRLWQEHFKEWQNRRFDPYIRIFAYRYLPAYHDWTLLKAVVHQESQFDPNARSKAGAAGLCQLMPETAADLGLTPEQRFDPILNLDAGARYLHWLWERWPTLPDNEGTWLRTRFVLASYNAGIGNVQQAWKASGYTSSWEVLEPHLPEETQQYVSRIMEQHYPFYRSAGLYQQPGYRTYLQGRTTLDTE